MSAFAAAINVIFADRNVGRDALYRPQKAGGGIPVRVILSQPDQIAQFNAGRFVVDTVILDVRTSDVDHAAKHDTFEILDSEGVSTGLTYVITGQPSRDAERLVWKCEAAEE